MLRWSLLGLPHKESLEDILGKRPPRWLRHLLKILNEIPKLVKAV